MLRQFLTREIFGRIATALCAGDEGEGGLASADLRAGLAAGQMVGMAMMRYIVDFPAVVEASQGGAWWQLVGPSIQRYLAP